MTLTKEQVFTMGSDPLIGRDAKGRPVIKCEYSIRSVTRTGAYAETKFPVRMMDGTEIS